MTFTEDIVEVIERSESELLAKHASWQRVPLGWVASVQNGAAFSSKCFNKERKGLPLIRIRDVGRSTTETYYSGDFDDRYIVRSGDILVGMDGDFRVAFWRGPTGLLNQRVCRISVRSDWYDPRFLVMVLQPYLDAINSRTSSVTVKHLSSRTIEDIPLPLPPRGEQARISSELEKLFSGLASGVRSLAGCRTKSSTLAAVVRNLAVQGQLIQFPRTGAGKDLLEEIIARRSGLVRARREIPTPPAGVAPEIPGHWALASVDQLCWKIEYGTSVKAGAKMLDSDVPVLRMGNIQNGRLEVNPNSLKYLPGDSDDIEELLLDVGDVLFNRTNSADLVGKAVAYHGLPKRATFASYLIRCRTVDGIDPEWLALVINSSHGRRYVKSVMTQQVGQANVNGTKLAALPVPLPPLSEQKQLIRYISECDEEISRVASTCAGLNKRSDNLRLSLLAEAFAGRLVEQDSDDEPASELLARIRTEREAGLPKQKTRSRRSKKELPAPPTRVTGDDYQQEELPL
ncbi:restriction endonuclease subunit S [Micromonospora sp. NPDC051196]|uniref:restriction endonuclease subunit S n=1 Tax=Micromonospora sp. NPDC051196 TaxID=3155281 RepID=UPI00342EDEA6